VTGNGADGTDVVLSIVVPARDEAANLGRLVDDVHTAFETVALPFRVDGSRVGHRSVAPAIGAQSAEVLAELGYSAEEIDDLAVAGVTRLT